MDNGGKNHMVSYVVQKTLIVTGFIIPVISWIIQECAVSSWDYIDWNDNRYDLNRLEPETLAAKVNMCHTINSGTRSEVWPSNREEVTQNDRSLTGDRLTMGLASASVRPAVRKRPNVIVVEPRKTANRPVICPVNVVPTPQVEVHKSRCVRTCSGGTESCSSRRGQGSQHGGPYGYTGPSERPDLQAAVLYDVDHGLC